MEYFLKRCYMNRKLKFMCLILITICILSPVRASFGEDAEVLCCRPVCGGCGAASDTMCDYKKFSQCRNLGGWEVEDCADCAKIDHPRQKDD